MTRDELEFSISQYLDGTLAELERDALETRLGSDPEARALFASYESLQAVLATAPLPAVRWDRLAEQISAAIAREALPVQSYKIGSWLRPGRLAAVAASVIVAAGITFGIFRHDRSGGTRPIAVEPIWIVMKPSPADAASAPAALVSPEPIRVAIGPPPAVDGETVMRVALDSVVERPSKAVIVSAAPIGQDTHLGPF